MAPHRDLTCQDVDDGSRTDDTNVVPKPNRMGRSSHFANGLDSSFMCYKAPGDWRAAKVQTLGLASVVYKRLTTKRGVHIYFLSVAISTPILPY